MAFLFAFEHIKSILFHGKIFLGKELLTERRSEISYQKCIYKMKIMILVLSGVMWQKTVFIVFAYGTGNVQKANVFQRDSVVDSGSGISCPRFS